MLEFLNWQTTVVENFLHGTHVELEFIILEFYITRVGQTQFL